MTTLRSVRTPPVSSQRPAAPTALPTAPTPPSSSTTTPPSSSDRFEPVGAVALRAAETLGQTLGLQLPPLTSLDPRRLVDGRVELELTLADGMTFTLPGPHGRPLQLEVPRSPYGTALRVSLTLGPARAEGEDPVVTSASLHFDTPRRDRDPTLPAMPSSAYPRVQNPTALQPAAPGPLAGIVARARDTVANLQLRGIDVDENGHLTLHGGVVALGREVSSLQALAGELPRVQTDVGALARGEVLATPMAAPPTTTPATTTTTTTSGPGPGLDALLRAFAMAATSGTWKAELGLRAPAGDGRVAVSNDGMLIVNRDLSLTATTRVAVDTGATQQSARLTTTVDAITGSGGLSVAVDQAGARRDVGGVVWDREGMRVRGVDVDALLPVRLQPWAGPGKAPRLGSADFAARLGALLDHDAPAVDGAQVRFVGSGTDVLRERLALIDSAGPGDTVLLQTFIFKDDVTGARVADALIRAKERGADVRVLIDAVGTVKGAADLVAGPPAYQRLRAAGVDARLFQHPAAALVRDDVQGPLSVLGAALRAVAADVVAAERAGTLPDLLKGLADAGAPGLVAVLETLSRKDALTALAEDPASLLRLGGTLVGAARELGSPARTLAAVVGEPLLGHLKTLLVETDVKDIVRGLGRDHRKQLVVMGERDGVPFARMGTGGNNIGDDYQVERGDPNHVASMDHVFWNDAELFIDSVDAVAGSAARFDLTWQAAGGTPSPGLARLLEQSSSSSSSRRPSAALRAARQASGASGASSSSSSPPVSSGERVRIVHHEPVAMAGGAGDDHYLHTLLALLEGAGRGDRIAIENPYFMPLPTVRDAMVQAAKRGAKITIVTNGLTENNDGQMVARMARRFSYQALVETKGIALYETLGTADPVHRKTLVATDAHGRDVWLVGSHNLDPLSARINREMFVVGGAGLEPSTWSASATGQALLSDIAKDTAATVARRVTVDELGPGPVEGVVADYALSLLSPLL